MSVIQNLLPFFGTAVLLFTVLFVGRFAFGVQARVLDHYSFSDQAFGQNNPAVTLRLLGLMIALVIAWVGGYQPEGEMWADLSSAVKAFVGGLVAVALSRYVNDYIILSGINNNDEVVRNRNISVAILECSTYVATACIFAGGMYDPSHGLAFNVAWFVVGQALLIGLAKLYFAMHPQVFDSIRKGVAAGALPVSGLLISAGIVLGVILKGDFETWTVDLIRIGLSLAVWLALVILMRVVVSIVLLPPKRLVQELVADGNWSAGLFDCLIMTAVTAAFVTIHG